MIILVIIKLVLLVNLSNVLCNCPSLQPPINGQIVGFCNSFPDSRCWIKCNNNQTLYTRVCTRYGFWSGNQLICSDNQYGNSTNSNSECSQKLQPPENGYFIGECNSYTGSVCQFACFHHFTLNGPREVICDGGQWSSQSPTCEKSANSSAEPLSGTESATNADEEVDNQVSNTFCPPLNIVYAIIDGHCNGAQIRPKAICNITCFDERFDGVTASLICQSNGQWNGTLPRCKRQIGGMPGFTGGGIRPGMTSIGGIRPPTSIPGMTSVGGIRPPTSIPGMTSTAAPRPCIGLTPPANGITVGRCNPGAANQQCSFICRRGFYLVGNPNLVCLSTGSWSSAAPICHRGNGCRLPTLRSNIIIGDCNSLIGGRCYYTCKNRINSSSSSSSSSSSPNYRRRTIKFWNIFRPATSSTTTAATFDFPSSSSSLSSSNAINNNSSQYYYSECLSNRSWNRPFRCPTSSQRPSYVWG